MKQSNMEELIRQMVREVLEDEDLDEITTTGGVAGYNTPNAFKDTDGTDEDDEADGDHIDKANKQTGYKRVSEVKLPVNWKDGKEEGQYINRWLELKKSDKTPNQKIGIGVRNIRYELQEMNKFLSWYNRIRTENSLAKDKYWKRTQSHLRKMKEQMVSIIRQVQEIDSSLEEINKNK